MFLMRAPDPTANLNTSLSEMLSAITNNQQQAHQQANHTSEMRDMSNNIMYMQALRSSFIPMINPMHGNYMVDPAVHQHAMGGNMQQQPNPQHAPADALFTGEGMESEHIRIVQSPSTTTSQIGFNSAMQGAQEQAHVAQATATTPKKKAARKPRATTPKTGKPTATTPKTVKKSLQHAGVTTTSVRNVTSLDASLSAAATTPNTSMDDAQGANHTKEVTQTIEELIAGADGDVGEMSNDEGPTQEEQRQAQDANGDGDDDVDEQEVNEMPRPTRRNPNYIDDREPFHTPGYKTKSKPPATSFYDKKGVRAGYVLVVGTLFNMLTWLPMFMYTGKPLYDNSWPLLALSLTIGVTTKNAPMEWLALFGEYLEHFGVCGVGGLERGGHLKHLHVQAVIIIHAPDDNIDAVVKCAK